MMRVKGWVWVRGVEGQMTRVKGGPGDEGQGLG